MFSFLKSPTTLSTLVFVLQNAKHGSASPAPLVTRDTVTSVVNLGNNTGAPQHLASGTLYGLPTTPNQIDSHWFTDIGWNYQRSGGAQLPAPARGWIWGLTEYQNRFANVLNDYQIARAHNASFIFLIHDLYGADGTQNSSTVYPGDNGDWTYWDNYLTHVISDMKANKMTVGMIIDIWNEPDLGTVFWGRSQAQYLQMWGRTYYRLRAEFASSLGAANQVLLSGPASAGEPLTNNGWWVNFLAFVKANGSIPDQWAWHMEGGGGDLVSAYGGLTTLLANNGLPMKPININEYGTYPEQVPAGSAWWISQLERINAHGLRGNWLSGYRLHDFLASLLGKPHGNVNTYVPTQADYWPNGDYFVYKYYNQNMTGTRLGSTPSADNMIDTYTTLGTDKIVRVLTGVRIATGTWNVQLTNLSAVGLPTSGTLNIHTFGFTAGADPHYDETNPPSDLGCYGHAYSGDTVTFPVFQTDKVTAYSFTFGTPGSVGPC